MVIPLFVEKFIESIYSAFIKQDYPDDLIFVVVWMIASIVAIYLPGLNETPIRVVLSLPIIIFIPGYSLISALFPKKDDLSNMERIALSVGFSAAIIPLIGLGLNFSPWGIWLNPIMLSLTIFSLGLILVAYYRRVTLPSEEQFMVKFSEIVITIRKSINSAENSRVDRILNYILVFFILAAIITTIFVIAFPKEGEHFSEFFILGGNKLATDYPVLINAGKTYPIYIGVGNHEYRNVNYTLETWAILREFDTITNTSKIKNMDPLDRQSFVLSHNQTVVLPYNLIINASEYNRVEFLLFNETIPGLNVTGSERINKSYRDLHLWVTINEGESQK